MKKYRKPCALTPLKKRHQTHNNLGWRRSSWKHHQNRGECRRRLLQIAHDRLKGQDMFIPQSTISAAMALRAKEAGLTW